MGCENTAKPKYVPQHIKMFLNILFVSLIIYDLIGN